MLIPLIPVNLAIFVFADSGELEDSCEYGDSRKSGNSGESGKFG